jgi:hypothetical protein
MNQVWLELVLIAHDLITWTQALLLTGDMAKAEPKRLRYTLRARTVRETERRLVASATCGE